MSNVSTLRLYLLRAMHLLIAVGLAFTVWLAILSPPKLVSFRRRSFSGAFVLRMFHHRTANLTTMPFNPLRALAVAA